jgi:hypothetical protein
MFFPGQQFTGDISQWSSTKAECEQVSLSSKGLRPPLNKSGVGLLAGRRLSRQDTLLITVPPIQHRCGGYRCHLGTISKSWICSASAIYMCVYIYINYMFMYVNTCIYMAGVNGLVGN